MTLPAYQDRLIPEGRYSFQITEEPEKKKFGKAVGVIIKFNIINEETGDMRPGSDLFWPWEERYKDLKTMIGDDEIEAVSKTFVARIKHFEHPTKPGETQAKIWNIEVPEILKTEKTESVPLDKEEPEEEEFPEKKDEDEDDVPW